MNKLLSLLLLISASVFAADITFEYEIPTTRTDGSALSLDEIDHFEMSANGGVIVSIPAVDAQNDPVEQYELVGTFEPCYTIAAVTKDGLRSVESDQACVPSAPSKIGSFIIKFVSE